LGSRYGVTAFAWLAEPKRPPGPELSPRRDFISNQPRLELSASRPLVGNSGLLVWILTTVPFRPVREMVSLGALVFARYALLRGGDEVVAALNHPTIGTIHGFDAGS